MLRLNKLIQQFRELEAGAGLKLIQRCLNSDLLRPEQQKKLTAIKAKGAKSFGLSSRGLKQFGHCKTASTAYWLLMGGKDRTGKSDLLLMKEKMKDGQLHFWLETEGGKRIDPTAAQLSAKLYPWHSYEKGKKVRMVGSNQGKHKVSLPGGKVKKIDQYTYQLLKCVQEAMKKK